MKPGNDNITLKCAQETVLTVGLRDKCRGASVDLVYADVRAKFKRTGDVSWAYSAVLM